MDESIFVPITFEKYRNNKISGLKTQLLIKKSFLQLKKIEEIRDLKEDYIKQLKKATNDIYRDLNLLQQQLPKLKGETQKQQQIIDKPKINYSNNIDDELEKIQAKLRALSS